MPARDVAFVRGCHRVWNGFLDDWRATPLAARRRWAARLGVGLALCVAASAALARLCARAAAGGALDWERDWLSRLAEAPWLSFHTAMWLETYGSSALIGPLLAVAVVLAALARRSARVLLLLGAYFPAKAIIFAGWLAWERARPDFVAGGIAVPPGLHSFPSGHTLQVATVYGVLAWLWVQASRSAVERVAAWLLAALLVGAVGLARLRLGTHWPSDVAAGLLLGGAWLAVLLRIHRKLEEPGPRSPR
jgi:undecaprenyl-diphosphatase